MSYAVSAHEYLRDDPYRQGEAEAFELAEHVLNDLISDIREDRLAREPY
jgi:hypothetical protein